MSRRSSAGSRSPGSARASTAAVGSSPLRSPASATRSSDYRRAAEGHGAERVLAIATSAVRDAENGEAFLGEIEWSYGFSTRLLGGDEEARLTFRGVTAGRGVADGTLVVDIGGGSTELIVAARRRLPRQPRPRVRAADGALRRGRRRVPSAGVRTELPGARRHAGGRRRRDGHLHRGARPRPRRLRPRASTGTGCRAPGRLPSSSGSRRCRSTIGAECPGSSRSARR